MKFFVPYQGGRPLALSVKGHQVLFVSYDEEPLSDYLQQLGADRICELRADSESDQENMLGSLARTIGGEVVVAPFDVEYQEVLRELEAQLPWVH